ncbi:hypothetical protein FGK63_01940 [Ruegeria sediminis]|uniref:Uncharacterized protein n=1 Tax=Ruegeria sediminis TaxID=2583820 RepID=A0ABY2X473_9RHOB|nr:hypothetical protein [Ruegeria sediminis]TMV09855.1 hypothetical protein FGK63_01940 [Ruegeria sediminis]
MTGHCVSKFANTPDAASAPRAPSGTCPAGHGDVPAGHFLPRARVAEFIRQVAFWASEILAAASLFVILFALLIFGAALQ